MTTIVESAYVQAHSINYNARKLTKRQAVLARMGHTFAPIWVERPAGAYYLSETDTWIVPIGWKEKVADQLIDWMAKIDALKKQRAKE